MAERRMLSRTIMEEDALLALPPRVVIVYILANLHADDDGMVDRIRSICKMMGGRDKDIQLLVDWGYLITFASGVVAIAHWRIHNRIRKDTYVPTKYTRELAMLETDRSGMYRLRNESVTQPCRECAGGKDSNNEERIVQGEERMEDILRQAQDVGIPVSFSVPVREWFAYKASRGEEQSHATIHSTLIQIKRNLDQHGEAAVGELIRLSIRNGWRGIFFERLGNADRLVPADYGSPEDLYT